MSSYYSYLDSENTCIAEDKAIGFLKGRLEETMPSRIRTNRPIIEQVGLNRGREIINSTVALIRTIPKDNHARIEHYLIEVFKGNRSRDEFVAYLLKYFPLTDYQATLIADDQIVKVAQILQVEKWKAQGVKKVKWVHTKGCRDSRVYHVTPWNGTSGAKDGKPNGLNGFVFPIGNPPVIDLKTGERGFPGQLINCQCHLEKA